MDDLEEYRQDALDAISARYAEGYLSQREFEMVLPVIRDAQSPEVIRSIVTNTGVQPRDADGAARSARHEPERSVTAILSERTMSISDLDGRRLNATAVLGSLTLDLRELVLTDDVHVQLFAMMGEVKILVPENAAVDNGINTILAEHNDAHRKPRLRSRDRDEPVLRLSGTAVLAELTVR